MASPQYDKFMATLLDSKLINLTVKFFLRNLEDYIKRQDNKIKSDPFFDVGRILLDFIYTDELHHAKLIPNKPTDQDKKDISKRLMDRISISEIIFLDKAIEQYSNEIFGSVGKLEDEYSQLMIADEIRFDTDKLNSKKAPLFITDKIRNAIMHSIQNIPRLRTNKSVIEILSQTVVVNSPGYSDHLSSRGHPNLAFDSPELGPNVTMTYGEYLIWKGKQIIKSIDETHFTNNYRT